MSDALADRIRLAQAGATRHLVRFRPTLREELEGLLETYDALPTDAQAWDSYGEGGVLAELERRVAETLGTEDAAFFVSGVMAQQAALRTYADRAGTRRVAMPDLSHLLVHEEDGPRMLHGFEVEALTHGAEVATAEHLARIPGRLAAVLVELPLRDAGYLLPSWDELTGLADACRERGVPLHLDGARLWESGPYLGRSPAEVAGLATTTYVSFYKGLGGWAGAALAGPKDLLDEARLWRRRMGGTIVSLAPMALSALQGLADMTDRMAELHEHAVALAAALQEVGFRTVPEVPHAVAFRLFAPGAPDQLRERVAAVVEETKVALPAGWRATDVPGWSMTEVTVSPATMEIPLGEASELMSRVLSH